MLSETGYGSWCAGIRVCTTSFFLFIALLITRGAHAQLGIPPLPQPAQQNAMAAAAAGEMTPHFAAIENPRVYPDRDQQPTIPHWSGSFSFQGLTYTYTMVGTDPSHGSATTIIPAVLIPMRFLFPGGVVYDAGGDLVGNRTAIDAILQSPLFQPQQFTSGGVALGNTQYGDAFQRANFWSSVSRQAQDYHVLLAPRVAPTIEVAVPSGAVSFSYDSISQSAVALVDDRLLASITRQAIDAAGVTPRELPIIVWGDVAGRSPWGQMSYGAFHGAFASPTGAQTYIGTGFWAGIDVYPLSHEILEWLNDPFTDNFTPGWNPAEVYLPHCLSTIPSWRDLLEVADPFQFGPDGSFSVATATGVYSLADGAFIDFFTHSPQSRSAGGRYSFHRELTAAPLPCTGHLEIERTLLPLPAGATWMHALRVNNHGVIAGVVADSSWRRHGFVYDGTTVTQIDYPGAVETIGRSINDAGQFLGNSIDATGEPHSFIYSNGVFTDIDVPSSYGTVARDFNATGDVVGIYGDAEGLGHGFLLHVGRYTTLDSPFGRETDVTAINDFGGKVGSSYDNIYFPSAFFLTNGTYTRLTWPFAAYARPWFLNNEGETGGQYIDLLLGRYFGAFVGSFVTINGNPYQIYANVWGMNDVAQIVGDTFDSRGRNVAFVAKLPK